MEPRYQGITLSGWTEKAQAAQANCADKDHPETDPEWQRCEVAVKSIGGKALPFLLKWIQAEDSAQKIKLIRWVNRKSWAERFDLWPDPALQKHLWATHGFGLLGRDARPAFPTLIQMTQSQNQERRLWGFIGFAVTKPEKEIFIPVASRLLHDNYEELKNTAAICFNNLYPVEAKSTGVCEIYPDICNPPTNRVIGTPGISISK